MEGWQALTPPAVIWMSWGAPCFSLLVLCVLWGWCGKRPCLYLSQRSQPALGSRRETEAPNLWGLCKEGPSKHTMDLPQSSTDWEGAERNSDWNVAQHLSELPSNDIQCLLSVQLPSLGRKGELACLNTRCCSQGGCKQDWHQVF